MNVKEAHVAALAVAVVSAAGTWALNGREDGRGAMITALAVAAWVAWVLVGRPMRAARLRTAPTENAHDTTLTDDHCITVLVVMAVSQLVLRYVVRDAPAADGSLTVSVFVALYLVWAYFGTRWLDRRRAARTSAPT